jgi:hypothetical protein
MGKSVTGTLNAEQMQQEAAKQQDMAGAASEQLADELQEWLLKPDMGRVAPL